MRPVFIVFFIVVLGSLSWLAAVENLYPDAGYEVSGTVGAAHSGQRAGRLTGTDEENWRSIGGKFSVEPFATYKATAWAKGKTATGHIEVLYAYQWDSYVWAFVSHSQMRAGDGWQKYEMTFCVPQDHVFLHPLAAYGSSVLDAYVDDIVVERIQSPEETIVRIQKQGDPQGDNARLLGRWLVQNGEIEAAVSLQGSVRDPKVKADIACVIGKSTDDTALRGRMLGEMLRCGAAEMNWGDRRIREVAASLPMETLVSAVCDAVEGDGGAEKVKMLAQTVVKSIQNGTGSDIPRPIGERLAKLRKLEAQVSYRATLLTGKPAYKDMEILRGELAGLLDKLEEELATYGSCRLIIGDKEITPETHAIVTSVTPTESEMTAAADLQVHIERVTGKLIPIVTDAACTGKVCLSVGKTRLVSKLGVEVDYDTLGEEGIRLAAVGPNLVLTGNRRGVLYATYVFLEEHVGCRWFAPDCITWPTEGTIRIRRLDRTYVPPFEYRDTDYPNCRPLKFGIRNRLNGVHSRATAEWGGKISYRGFVHTFNSLVPPEKYFGEHPEYFSEIDGVRVGERTQLCLTNPDMLRIATETVLRWIEESPEATIISVSQNDWHNFCTCDRCRALAEKEGSQSGPLLHFVNAIAREVAKGHPHIIIDTLAYQYTRKPPTFVRPEPNVAIRLCSIECEFNRPLAKSKYNRSFVEDIRGWNRICDRLHIWDYVINYAHCIQPFPNLDVLQPNIQFFMKNGVTGIYEEANYFSKGGELAELRTYLLAKLLWDPDCDVSKSRDEFGEAYYGPAWPPIRKYISDIHRKAVSDRDFHMRIYIGQNSPFQTDKSIEKYAALFDEAESLARDDETFLHRVRVARLPIMYTQIMKRSNPLYELTQDALVPIGEAGGTALLVDRFETIASREGITRIAENRTRGPIKDWITTVRRAADRYPVVALKGSRLTAVVVPSLGGRLLSLTVDGNEVLKLTRNAEGIDPTIGGYKEFSETGYRSPGWIEPYRVVAQTPTSVTVEGAFKNNLALHRIYTIDSDAPILRVSSILKNTGANAVKGGFRVHPCFFLGDADRAVVNIKGNVGDRVFCLAEGKNAEKELWFRGDAQPAGEWSVTDPEVGRTVTSRFDPVQVGTCYLNWNGPDHRVNLELWSITRELKPGETLQLEHEYEFSDTIK